MPDTLADGTAVGLASATGWVALAGLERLHPHRQEWSPADEDARTDVTHLLLIVPIGGLAAKAMAAAAARRVLERTARKSGRTAWPRRRPLVVRVALALVITEFVHYWHHRWSHEVHLLWRFHAVHHSSRRLNWLNATRFHPVDLIPFVSLQDFALLALGIDSDAFVATSVLKGVHGQLQHANIEGSGGPLNHVFSPPDQHRWHHARTADGRSRNYGAVLSIWDRIFGTQYIPDPTQRFEEPIGIGDDRYGPGWSSLMAEPFRSPTPS